MDSASRNGPASDCPRAVGVRWLFSASGPPLRDAYVIAAQGRIQTITTRRPDLPTLDRFDCALLPGLINAHTHLEFSHLACPLGTPGQSFTDWLRVVIAQRRAEAASGHPQVIQERWQTGVQELKQCGTRWAGDIVSFDFSASRLGPFLSRVPLRLVAFRELLGLPRPRWPQLRQTAEQYIAQWQQDDRCQPGWSPHAPYTVSPEFLAGIVQRAQQLRLPLAMHLAESPEECELFRTGGGPLRDLLEAFDAWDVTAFPVPNSPEEYLRLLSAAPHALVIHGNYLDACQRQWLADHRPQMSLVYCPRTHAFFRHSTYPLLDCLARGVRIVLGTDSRATNPDLSIFEEMRYVAEHYPGVDPAAIVCMTTRWAAEALGLSAVAGTVAPGKLAEVTLVRLRQPEPADPYEALWEATPLADNPLAEAA